MMKGTLVLATLVAVSLCTTWPCTFTDPNGLFYDFTAVNTNTSDKMGWGRESNIQSKEVLMISFSGCGSKWTWKILTGTFGSSATPRLCAFSPLFMIKSHLAVLRIPQLDSPHVTQTLQFDIYFLILSNSHEKCFFSITISTGLPAAGNTPRQELWHRTSIDLLFERWKRHRHVHPRW